MNLLSANKENIEKAALIIKSGGLVAFPTETVYGLGANVFDPIAVGKIFEVKERPFFDPLIVHIASFQMAEEVAENLGPVEQKLAQAFWPGPLTLILQKKPDVPDIVTSGLSTIAVRMPSNDIARQLISQAGLPVAAPSANPFGRISPTKAEHVLKQLGDKIEMILDGGNCEMGIESTIIKVEDNITYILRHGAIPAEEILKKTEIQVVEKAIQSDAKPETPGQLQSHYSPKTSIVFIDEIAESKINPDNAGYLAFSEPDYSLPFKKVEVLSKSGDLREAAANLFSHLHHLDSEGLDIIYADRVPANGLGAAIMDRLNRAVKKSSR